MAAAREKAMMLPPVAAAREDMEATNRDFLEVARVVAMKKDPTLQPIFDKIEAEREARRSRFRPPPPAVSGSASMMMEEGQPTPTPPPTPNPGPPESVLNDQERQRLGEARMLIRDDPQIQEAEALRIKAESLFQDELRAGMLKVDPEIGPLLERMPRQMPADRRMKMSFGF